MYVLAVGEQFIRGFASDDSWRTLIYIYWPIALAPALFTWLLPGIFGYRRGGMALVGACISSILTALLPLQFMYGPLGDLYYLHVHPWLYVIFYIYVVFGLLLCLVGIYDRKRSAIWALVAVLSLTSAAAIDTIIWLGWASGQPWLPYGFIGFALATIIAYVRRGADAHLQVDLRDKSTDVRNNATRRSRSIPRTLLRNGNLHLLPLYYVICLSDLGREGIQNSGSFRFADHIYVSQPSGRTFFGRWLDGRMLTLPATQAFRLRYKHAQRAIREGLERFPADVTPLRWLSLPCGIPRDLMELAGKLKEENPALLDCLEYFGMDLDPELLTVAEEFATDCPVRTSHFHCGNALLPEQYPPGEFHAVVSTGLGEFLTDDEIRCLYRNVHTALAPGGTFYTSATSHEMRSERLMRAFELYTQYRTSDQLRDLLGELPWQKVTIVNDDAGLQSFVTAVK